MSRIKKSEGEVTTAVPALPEEHRVAEPTVQCRCPFCGGCFDQAPGMPPVCDGPYRCGCASCGHNWMSRTENPSRCPRCGIPRRKESQEPCSCRRCGYRWSPRSAGRPPAACPSCRSKEWDDEAAEGEVDRELVLAMYGSGDGCIAIASEMGAALFEVIGIVREATGDDTPRLRSECSEPPSFRCIRHRAGSCGFP